MHLYVDEYLLMSYKKEMSFFKIEWKAESVRLNIESFKNRLNYIDDFMATYQPSHVLVDCSHLVYKKLNGNEGLLINEVVTDIYESKLSKLAIVNSYDKITRTLINEIVFDPRLKQAATNVFEEMTEAQMWLLSDKDISILQKKHLIAAQ